MTGQTGVGLELAQITLTESNCKNDLAGGIEVLAATASRINIIHSAIARIQQGTVDFDFGAAEMQIKYDGLAGDLMTWANAFLESATTRVDLRVPADKDSTPSNTALIVYSDANAGTGTNGTIQIQVYYTQILADYAP